MEAVIALNLLLVTLVTAVYVFFRMKFRYWKLRNVPYLEPSFPMGNMAGVSVKKPMSIISKELYDSLPDEPFIGIWTTYLPSLLLRDPELIKQVCVKDFTVFQDRGAYGNEKSDPLSAHLFNISGQKWKNIRTKLTPTFTSGKMKMMFPAVVECSSKLVQVLTTVTAAEDQVIDIKEYSARFTTDVITICAFGIQANALDNPNAMFRIMGRKIFEPNLVKNVKVLLSFFAPSLAKSLKVTRTPKEVTKFFLGAVQDTITYRETTHTSRPDFMQLLIQLKNTGSVQETTHEKAVETKGSNFTFVDAAANAYSFFFAGFETSSTTMQFALYELALHPDIQERTRQEMLEVLGQHENQLTYETVNSMDYLHRVIEETLRKYPPAPVVTRKCTRNYKVPGSELVLQKGTMVQIPIYAIQNDPKHFPEPHKFDPDRFTAEIKATRHHYAYLPFGEGPRNCIGMRFGLMQTKVGLTALLTNFSFQLVDAGPMEFQPRSFVMAPRNEIQLRVHKLNNN